MARRFGDQDSQRHAHPDPRHEPTAEEICASLLADEGARIIENVEKTLAEKVRQCENMLTVQKHEDMLSRHYNALTRDLAELD